MATGVGQLINNRFVVEAFLGEGGMATVWRVCETATGRRSALKCLSTMRGSAVSRLEREGLIQGALSHPNLVAVEEVLEVDGGPALLLELVDGGSLDALLGQASLDLHHVDALAAGILSGVAAAHAAGAVHRDLKPGNILLQHDGEVVIPRIADFGMARLISPEDDGQPLTRTGVVMGTPHYMAPEQASTPREVGIQADLWAVGCILYEMICGQRPFAGSDAHQILRSIADGRYLPPEALRPDIPPRWASTIRQALVVDPAQRIGDAAAMAALWGTLGDAPPSLWVPLLPLIRGSVGGRSPGGTTSATQDMLLVSAEEQRYSLPPEQDAFIGRTADLVALSALVAVPGVVSILGVGGVGKTRLAVRLGWQHIDRLPGGVWLGDLSEARDARDICEALAEVLGVPLDGPAPIDQLGNALRERGRCLIILDNFEQVAAHAEETLARWAVQAPQATFLVTTRAVLGVPGERISALEPLPVETDAVALFVERARLGQPRFSLFDGNREDITAIAALLDGLPLAIELAAARVRILSPTQLRARLQDRFRLLSRPAGTEGRQATLRAAIDWSWTLLEPGEQATLAQCSLFEGGFDLEAAEAAVDLSACGPEAPWVLDAVQSLVEKSLLRQVSTAAEEPRFDTFLSIRAYAREKLCQPEAFPGASPALLVATHQRHGAHFAAQVPPPSPTCHRLAPAALQRLQREQDNLMAACRWAIAAPAAAPALESFRGLWMLLRDRGPLETLHRLSVAILALPILTPRERLQILMLASEIHYIVGEVESAEAILAEGLAIARHLNASLEQGLLLLNQVEIRLHQGQHQQASPLIDEALVLASRVMVPYLEACALCHRGRALAMHHPAQALPVFQQALVLARRERHSHLEMSIQISLGDWLRSRDRLDEARTPFEEVLRLARQLGSLRVEGTALLNLGTILQRQGHSRAAESHYAAALAIARQIGSARSIASNLHNLASLKLQAGALDDAHLLFVDALQASIACNQAAFRISSRNGLGTIAARQGDLALARQYLEVSLADVREHNLTAFLGVTLMKLATLSMRESRLEDAWQYIREGEDYARQYQIPSGIFAMGTLRQILATHRETPDPEVPSAADLEAVAATLHPSQCERILSAIHEILSPAAPPSAR